MIYITGDTHIPINIGKLDINEFHEQENMNKNDCVIICGDFGGVWDNGNEDMYWRKWLDDKNFTTLFVDGNHENFHLLNTYPIEMWNGGKVHKINDSIIHLMRGQVFNINGVKIFSMGGASSHDKECRQEFISWWKEELPSNEEYEEGLSNLEKNNWKVDYIISHCCSSNILETVSEYCSFDKYDYEIDSLNKYFDIIEKQVNYRKWYFGHYHGDVSLDDKHTMLFQKIVKI